MHWLQALPCSRPRMAWLQVIASLRIAMLALRHAPAHKLCAAAIKGIKDAGRSNGKH